MRKFPLLLLILLVLPISADAAVAFDVSSSGSGTNPASGAFTVSSSANRMCIVHLLPFGASRTASACTCGGVSMTQIMDSVTNTIDGAGAHTYIYASVAPASGSQTASCTTTSTYGLQVMTYTGVDQTNPLDPNFDGASHTFVEAQSSVLNNNSNTLTGTSHVDNSLGNGFNEYSGASVTAGANTTQRVAVQFFSWEETTATTPAGSLAMAIKNNSGGTENIYFTIVAIQPAAVTTPQTPYLNRGLIWLDD